MPKLLKILILLGFPLALCGVAVALHWAVQKVVLARDPRARRLFALTDEGNALLDETRERYGDQWADYSPEVRAEIEAQAREMLALEPTVTVRRLMRRNSVLLALGLLCVLASIALGFVKLSP